MFVFFLKLKLYAKAVYKNSAMVVTMELWGGGKVLKLTGMIWGKINLKS